MSFQPVLPLAGYGGWRFLQRTLDQQQTAFQRSAPIQRATDYFRDKIGEVRSAEDLVKDRRLLEVALGAFGLDDDINNKFFIGKILAEGTGSRDALAMKLADTRYRTLAAEFGFGDAGGARTGLSFFADRIIARFEARQFERAVGAQDNDMRAAMNVKTALSDILERTQTEDGRWFSMLGNAPLRRVFETALGLPASIAGIDLDQQLGEFKDRARATFGTDTLADFADPAQQEKLIRLFLIRSEAQASASTSRASVALALLQGA